MHSKSVLFKGSMSFLQKLRWILELFLDKSKILLTGRAHLVQLVLARGSLSLGPYSGKKGVGMQ